MISTHVRLEVKFDLTPRIQRRLQALKERAAIVGWPGEGSPLHLERMADGSFKTHPTMTVAQVAAVHEFGSPEHNVPARPMLRTAAAYHAHEIGPFFAPILKRYVEGRGEPDATMRRIGSFWKGKVRRMFITEAENTWKPLKEETLEARRAKKFFGTKKLLDTKHLRESLDYKAVAASYR